MKSFYNSYLTQLLPVSIDISNIMNANANINSLVTKGLTMAFMDYTISVIRQLADKYSFEPDAEIHEFQQNFSLTFNKKQKSDKPRRIKWKLPFNGVIYANKCHAVSKANLLFIQCDKSPVEGSDLCKSCLNNLAKLGELPYGRIESRFEKGDDFLVNNTAPIPYSLYMKKFNIDREMVIQHAAEHNIVLHERHFIEVDTPKPKGRGRKPKSPVTVQTDNYSTDDDDFASIILSDMVNDIIHDTATQVSKKHHKNSKHLPEPVPEPVTQPVTETKKSKKEDKKSKPLPEPVTEHVTEHVTESKKEDKKSKKSKPVPETVTESKKEDKKSKKSKPVPETEPEPEPELSSEDEDELEDAKPVEVKVKKMLYNDNSYWVNLATNEAYDANKNIVGSFDPKTKAVNLFDDNSDIEDLEDDDEDDRDN